MEKGVGMSEFEPSPEALRAAAKMLVGVRDRIEQERKDENMAKTQVREPGVMTGLSHGVDIRNFRQGTLPRNTLPTWIREGARIRGYGDGVLMFPTLITLDDRDVAWDLQAHGDGDACVVAQSAKRWGVINAYMYRTTAWIDFDGVGPIVRYMVSARLRENVINPFDDRQFDLIVPGMYELLAPTRTKDLSAATRAVQRERQRRRRAENPDPGKHGIKTRPVAFMGRVIAGQGM